MKQIIAALAVLSMFGFGVVGCGGDDDDNSTSNGGSANGGEPATSNGGEPAASNGGEPATNNGGAPGSPNLSCDASLKGVCQNDMDCPFVVDGSARTKAQTCGQGCVLSGSEDPNCARDCMLKDLDMSSECAACYADIVSCTAKNCLGQCLTAPDSEACAQCQVDKGCRGAFNDCSGLPPE